MREACLSWPGGTTRSQDMTFFNHPYDSFAQILGTVQFWVAASSAAWGWQNSESGATIPKSFGFEAATPYETTNNVTENLTYLNHARFFG